MTYRIADRVQQTTTSTGLGALLLTGSVAKMFSFGESGFVDGDTFPALIEHDTASEVEITDCTYHAGTPPYITRADMPDESSTGQKIDFSPGSKTISVVASAKNIVAPLVQPWTRQRRIPDAMRDRPSILDFNGIDPTGNNDSTSGLQAALNEATGNGGLSLALPPGKYVHSGLTIGVDGDMTKGQIAVLGMGARATDHAPGVELLCSNPAVDHLTVYDAEGTTIDGLSFGMAPGVTPTAGSAVRVVRGDRFAMKNFRISGLFNGLDIFASTVPLLEHGEILGLIGTIGISLTAQANRQISRAHIHNVRVAPTPNTPGGLGSETCDGMLIGDYVNSTYINWLQLGMCRYGLVVGQGGETRPAFIRIGAIGIENARIDGVLLNNWTHLWIDELYSCLHGGNGITIAPVADAYSGAIWLDNPRISGNGGHGISGQGRASVYIQGFRGGTNGHPNRGAVPNTKDAINISASEFYLYLLGSRPGGNIRELDRDQDQFQRFGLRLEPTLQKGIIQVHDSNFSGNVSREISDEAGPAVVRNIGESNVSLGPAVSIAPTGRRNRLHNGSFEIWQRGTSFSYTATHGGTADRWTLTLGSGTTIAASQVPGLGRRSRNAIRLQRPAANTGTGICLFEQALTLDQVIALRGSVLTMSYLCRIGANFSSAMSSARIAFGTGSAGRRGNVAFTNETGTTSVPHVNNASRAITGITNAAIPTVDCVGHGFTAGSRLTFRGVGGMTEINGVVARIDSVPDADHFTIKFTDTSGFGAYTSGGTASIWPSNGPQAITGITKANPGVVSCPGHGLAPGSTSIIDGVSGMTEMNTQRVVVDVIDDDTFSVGIDTTGYSNYVSGGLAYPIIRAVHTTSFVVPANATQGCVQFTQTPVGTAGTDDWIEIDEIQLEYGWQATQFEQRMFHEDLADCQRFFRKSFPYATAPAQNAGTTGAQLVQLPTGASGTFGGKIAFDAPMAASPTVITFNPSAANANWRDGTNSADRTVTVAGQSDNGFEVTGASGVAGSANRIHYTADCDFT